MYDSLTRKANTLGFDLVSSEKEIYVLCLVDMNGTIVFTGTYGQVFSFLN